MEPIVNAAKPLRLFDLGSDDFQRLCRAMLRETDGVRTADIYGVSGQRQRGIDIEVTLHSQARWVAQCKASERNALKHLHQAVADFLPHVDFWRKAGIKKFIVLFGCGVEDTKVFDAKRQYEREFATRQIGFEIWDSSEIRLRLREMRSVVEQFLPQLLDEICGKPPRVSLSAGSSLEQHSISSALIAELGTTHNERLDHIRDLIRAGKEASAELELRQMLTSTAWSVLRPDLRARAFRLLAGIALNRRRDVDEARKLLERAKEVHPTGRFVVMETVIRNIAEGPTAALEKMPEASDRDEWNLRAALLINQGRAAEALKVLQSPAFSADAETCRLRALAHLVEREIPQAQAAAAEALARSGEWALVQQAVGLTEYFSAISPAFEGWNHWRWPLPMDWHLVRSDAESRAALRRASERFAQLAQNEDRGSEDWEQMVAWQLACLANDSARQAEAAHLVRENLEINPAMVPAIVWALARDYDFPQESAQQALERICNKGSENTEPVQALFSLLASGKKFAEAGGLLDTHRELYQRAGLLGPWQFQRGQVLMAAGDTAAAEVLLAEQTDPDLRERTRAAFARISSISGGWTPESLAQLDAEARRTNSDDSLFAACEAHHFAGQHDYVVERADDLVRLLATEPALRLALDACASAKRYALCIILMERYRSVFREGDFPPAIRRLRVSCLRKVGRLLEAEQELRLLSPEGLSEDRFDLFQLQLSTGKVTEASSTARTLLDDPNITPEGLLQIAEKLRPDDPDLARTFFAQATQRGVESPHGAALGMHVGFNLGLDDQIGGLTQKALSAVDDPDSPLKPFTIEQILEMQRDWDQSRSEAETKYQRGLIAVHGLAGATGEPLATFFHLRLANNESANIRPNDCWSLRARYGARREPALISQVNPNLFLDITSLMLAAHLEVLPLLEAEYAPIGISAWVMHSLHAQIETLTAGQPARVPPKEEVLQLLAEGRIATLSLENASETSGSILEPQMGERWCTLLAHAQREGGWLIDFLPVTSNDGSMAPVTLGDEISPFVRGVGDVLHACESEAELSSTQDGIAKLRLGSMFTHRAGEIHLNKDKTVVLEIGIAEQLANAGLLRLLSSRTKVVIHPHEPPLLRHELAQLDTRQELTGWLRRLREQLRSGLDSGIYREEPNLDAADEIGESAPTELRILRDFIDLKRSSSTLSCCDDRMLGKLSHVGESQVVGVFDLLWNLRARGKINTEQLFAHLHRLRTANIRYLPISVKEIVYHIRKARIEEHELVETPELATLRRYAAGCLLDWDLLQRLPANHPEAMQQSEILFGPGLHNTIQHAIGAVWKDRQLSPAACVAASDWIIESLWFDLTALSTLSNPPLPPAEKLFGMSEAQLAFEALGIKPVKISGLRDDKRTVYLSWLFSRLGGERRRTKHLTSELKRVMLSLIKGHQLEAEREVAGNLISGVFDSLPESVNSAIHFTRVELRLLRWETFSTVPFGDVVFDGRLFWPAARGALIDKRTVVAANMPHGKRFNISSDAAATSPVLVVAAEDDSIRFRVTEPSLGLLCGNTKQRVAILTDLRREFDKSVAEANSFFPKLARTKRVELLMREIVEMRAASFVSQLTAIREKIAQHQQLDLLLARPRGDRMLLQHLRLPAKFADGELLDHVEASVRVLIADEGFEEAFMRIAALPIALPRALHDAFAELPTPERESLLQNAAQNTSPFLRFQAASLFLHSGEIEQSLATDMLVALASDEAEDQWDLFQRMLLWTEACLLADSESTRSSSAPTLAAVWIHAARLHQSFPGAQVPESATAYFRSNNFSPAVAAFDSQTVSWHDVASPRSFDRTRLLLVGLSGQLNGVLLKQDLRERLNAALSAIAFPAESDGLPSLRLLELRSTASNRLGSFMGACDVDALRHVLGMENATRFADETIENDASEYINQLIQEPQKVELWTCLAAYLKAQPPTEAQRPSFRAALAALSFKSFANPTLDQLQLVAMFLFGQTVHCNEGVEAGVWEAKLFELADVITNPVRRFPIETSALLVGNCAFLLAHAESGETEAARRFSDVTTEIAKRWPTTADRLLQPTVRVLLRQPSDVHAQAWRAAIELRCSAEKLRPMNQLQKQQTG